ncbi:Mpv17 / PMP22 family domain containing protein [Lactarius tabidus]
MASLFRSFNNLLLKRPFATQCATSAVLFSTGDVIAQQVIERKRSKHDFSRTARLLFYGGCLFGPPISKWIAFLGRLRFSTPTKTIIYRTWLDQTLMGPFIVGWFFASMSLMEGKGTSGVADTLSTKYAPTLMRGWMVFIPAQIINFAVVPPQLRFVFLSSVSLVWSTYLSFVNAKPVNDVAKPVDQVANSIPSGVEHR